MSILRAFGLMSVDEHKRLMREQLDAHVRVMNGLGARITRVVREIRGSQKGLIRLQRRYKKLQQSPANQQARVENLLNALNKRVDVEQYLLDVHNNKRPIPTRDECRKLAVKLGAPVEQHTPELKELRNDNRS